MLVSKLSSKGQVTIPKEVRECLRVRAGDPIEYEVQGNVVVVRRIEPFDRAFHSAISDTLTEWPSPEDEKVFGDM